MNCFTWMRNGSTVSLLFIQESLQSFRSTLTLSPSMISRSCLTENWSRHDCCTSTTTENLSWSWTWIEFLLSAFNFQPSSSNYQLKLTDTWSQTFILSSALSFLSLWLHCNCILTKLNSSKAVTHLNLIKRLIKQFDICFISASLHFRETEFLWVFRKAENKSVTFDIHILIFVE